MSSRAMILIHAPSVYDFRKLDILRGPISDLVPSSSVFEMYPMGFTTIAAHLETCGYSVRIVNLAARMLRDAHFDVEQFIQRLPPPLVFGLDLHWLPHAHGALAVAEILKRHFPDTPVLFGGFSSTYYHRELIDYPQVDFVIRGDSTEDAVRQLVEALSQGGPLASVPNLTWRDADGQVQVNPMSYSPPDLSGIDMDFRRIMIAAMRDRDLPSYLPFTGWLRYPIMPILSCRGCVMNCVGCGGSAYAFEHMHGRKRPAFRPPEQLADDFRRIASVSNGPVFVLGDIRQAGHDYARTFLDHVRGIDNPVIIELFWPAGHEFLHEVSETLPDYTLEFSIESHDPLVREAYGKSYSNDQVEQTLRAALDTGARRIDLFFMIGLPQQTYRSVMESASYAEDLVVKYGEGDRLLPFIGPLAPFLDPGSPGFEHPEQHGYVLHYRTLEEHRRALTEPSWQFTLNYESHWMTRRDIVLSTYDAGLRFAEFKARHGLVESDEARIVQAALHEGRSLALEIEELRGRDGSQRLHALRPRIEAVNEVRVLEEESELELSVPPGPFKLLYLLLILLWAWSADKGRRLSRLARTMSTKH